MKKIYSVIFATLVAFLTVGAGSLSAKEVASIQSVQVFVADNKDGKITPQLISEAFTKVGLKSSGNNDMNKPFSQRFPKLHYKTYNLAMFKNDALTLALIKKYPNFGVLAPMTMSIWEDKGAMNISTLTIDGMARVANIPLTDPDLIAYSAMVTKALKQAMPNGKFKVLDFLVKDPKESFAINFSMEVDIDEDTSLEDFREDFEGEFEGELEPIGFLMPNYLNLQEDMFEDAGYEAYDFYVTYSVCKFDVIYPVSRLHPEAGAYAPCSFFLYKKKGEDTMHMGYLGVKNWIETLDIKEQESIKPLLEAQEMINNIVTEITE
ncbi:MAG: hypothetical protein U9P38_08295 [Campylobacterota bacterium]|nr:hypothetical protein [Campylobacterota bacterium]